MERRDTDRSGGVTNSPAWQTVRRALGRLIGRVGVRSAAEFERAIPASILRVDLSSPGPPMPGGGWQPKAAIRTAAVPQAGTGLRESSLLPTADLVGGDFALAVPAIRAMPAAALETRTQEAGLEWPVGTTGLPESFLRLPASPVRVERAALLPLPTATPLRGWLLHMPPVQALRPPRQAAPRVRWGGDSVLRRMPLTRSSREMHPDTAGAMLAAEHRLAETVHLRREEITLLGVYPDIPILAVERIVVEDEGRRLRLWLKPEVLRGRTAPHQITLLVGRQISTGKMLQAAL